MTRTYHFVPWLYLDDWLRLGWLPVADLGPTHGEWSCLCQWLCDCPMVHPFYDAPRGL